MKLTRKLFRKVSVEVRQLRRELPYEQFRTSVNVLLKQNISHADLLKIIAYDTGDRIHRDHLRRVDLMFDASNRRASLLKAQLCIELFVEKMM